MKKIISLLIVVLIFCSALAVNCGAIKYDGTIVVNHIKYEKIIETDRNTKETKAHYSVVSLFDSNEAKKTVKEINIPSEINGIPVTEFQSHYEDWPNHRYAIVEKITLPATITTIGSAAFINLIKLKEINLPESVETIESNAFNGCFSLESIVFPEKVTTITSNVCYRCVNLENVEFKGKVTSIQSNAFNSCENLKTLKIPESLKSLGNTVFINTKISSITLPKNIATKNKPFTKNNQLKKITLNSLKGGFYGSYFTDCKSLKEVHLESIKTFKKFNISKNAFNGTKPGIKFYVKNKKAAKALYNGLKKRNIKKAKIFIGKKLVYKTNR